MIHKLMSKTLFFLFFLQLNLMSPFDYIPPVDIKTEPYIPETGTQTGVITVTAVLYMLNFVLLHSLA